MHRRSCQGILASILALALSAAPVFAQITTGTISGTVRDEQGGVIPGATVVLISETRGTRSAPAVTNEAGSYVIPERHARYLHHRSHDGGLQDRQASPASAVSGGDRVGVPPVTLEPGTLAETVNVVGESADGPDVRAASGRSRSRATQIENLPIARNNFTSVTAFDPGRGAHRRVGRRHPPRRRRTEQHHDGRHLGDGHRQQRPDAADERRLDRRSEDPHAGLPGRVRPLERPADHGRHQERLESVPRLRLRHHDQLGLGREQPG